MALTICAPQLTVSGETNLGGAVIDRDLLVGLAERGHRIELLLPEGEASLDHPNVRTTYVQRNWLLSRSYGINLFFAGALLKVMRRNHVDVLRAFSPYSIGIASSLFRSLKGRPALWLSYHHLEGRADWALLDRFLPRLADGISVGSRDTFEELQRRCPAIGRKLFRVVPYGIQTERFRRMADPRAEEIVPVRPGCPLVLFVGRLIRRKGIPLLLESWREVVSRHPEAQLLIIGDGPLKGQVVRASEETPGIVQRDFVSKEELLRIYSASDLFVFPTEKEGFGLAVGEAMSCGLPVVTTAALGVRELVLDGETGYQVAEATAKTFAEKICGLLRDEGLRRKMGEAGAQRIRDHFSWDRTMDGVEKFLEALVGEGDP